jgi:transposase-like protein
LRLVYTAVNADAAQDVLPEWAETDLGRRHKAATAVWERARDPFTPFLELPPDSRKAHQVACSRRQGRPRPGASAM